MDVLAPNPDTHGAISSGDGEVMLDSIVLDKCYLQGARYSEIESLSKRRNLVMSGALFYELLDTEAEKRVRCFAKFPPTDNPVALVDHVGALLQRELAQLRPCGKPSSNTIDIRFQFNPALLNDSYELPHEVVEVMQLERQDLANESLSLVGLSETIEPAFPGLLQGSDEQRLQRRYEAEAHIADCEWARMCYGQLRSPDPLSPFPDAALVGPEWAHLRWVQVKLLFSLDLFIRYQGKLRNMLTNGVLKRLEHDVHDAQALALGVLEGALATREEKIGRWFKLLRPDGELVS